jgi:hypothetical protein
MSKIVLVAAVLLFSVGCEPEGEAQFDLRWVAAGEHDCGDIALPDVLTVGEATRYEITACTSWGEARMVSHDETQVTLGGTQVESCDGKITRIGSAVLAVQGGGESIEGEVQVRDLRVGENACLATFKVTGTRR